MDAWILTRSTTMPAIRGPMIRTAFQMMDSMATALTMCSRSTSRGKTLERLGWSKACTAPITPAVTKRCHGSTHPVSTIVASKATAVAEIAWAPATRYLGSSRSARTPPKRLKKMAGRAMAIDSQVMSSTFSVRSYIVHCRVKLRSIW